MEENAAISNTRIKTIGVIVVAVLVIVALIAFTKSLLPQSKTSVGPTIVPVSQNTLSLYLPATFPTDMPLVTRGKVTTAAETSTGWTAVFLAASSVDEAKTYYEEKLPSSGWTITNQSNAGGLTLFYAEKDTKEAIVAVGRGDEGTTVSITLIKKSQ